MPGVSLSSMCPALTLDELGNASIPSSVGLVPQILGTMSGTGPPSVQIIDANAVCLGQGLFRGMYHSSSLIIRILRAFDNMVVNIQVDFQCVNEHWMVSENVTMSPELTLTTEPRTDCIQCDDLLYSDEYHCVGKYKLESVPVCIIHTLKPIKWAYGVV
jgi:hypothetical protein